MAAAFKLRFPGVFLFMISAVGRPRGMAGKVGQSNSVCIYLLVGGRLPLRPSESNA